MASINFIKELADLLTEQHIVNINGKQKIIFRSGDCADYTVILEYLSVVSTYNYDAWTVQINHNYLPNYHTEGVWRGPDDACHWPGLKLDGWSTTEDLMDSLVDALEQAQDRQNHRFDSMVKALMGKESKEAKPILYRVTLRERRKGVTWLWAMNKRDAYDKARSFEESGAIDVDEYLDTELEVEEEYGTPSADMILNNDEVGLSQGH